MAAALTGKQRRLLKNLHEFAQDNPYPPIPSDFAQNQNEYEKLKKQLYKLEKEGWIVIHRRRRYIRAIQVLMLP